MKRLASLVAIAALGSCAAPPPAAEPEGRATVSLEGAEPATHAERVAHGERLATLLACTSCHGDDLTGGDYGEDADGGFIFASNLTRAVPRLSDQQLRRLLAEGVHPSRERIYYMPSKTLQRLSVADMDALMAFLRSLEPSGQDWPVPVEGETTMALVELGILETSNDRVAAYRRHRPPVVEGAELGRYVASVTCAECHGPALDGEWASAPSLRQVLAHHDDESLSALLAGHGGRGDEPGGGSGLMPLVASRNLSALTTSEREALIAYLLGLSTKE